MKMMLWILLAVLVVLALVVVGYLTYARTTGNANVEHELRTNPQGDRAKLVMLLTFPDGRILPVNYLREGHRVYVGADGPWWRALRDGNVPVSLMIRGETLTGRAHVVFDDPDYTRDVFTRLRPNVPKWLPDWLNAYLVVIELDGT